MAVAVLLHLSSYPTMTTNPSHILIARNSRGLNNPAASLSSPTETHAAASGIFRSSGSPPWLFEDCESDEIESELSADEEEAIEIHETFTKNCRFPGTVKIVVESTTFWYAHSSTPFAPCLFLDSPGLTKRFCSLPLPFSRPLSVEIGLRLRALFLCRLRPQFPQ